MDKQLSKNSKKDIREYILYCKNLGKSDKEIINDLVLNKWEREEAESVVKKFSVEMDNELKETHLTHQSGYKQESSLKQTKILIIFAIAAVITGCTLFVYLNFFAPSVNPCSSNLGWQNTPCTYVHSSVDETVMEKIEDTANVATARKLSWDTKVGRIYLVGCPGPDVKDSLFSFFYIKPVHGQININLCEGVCIGGEQAQYFNARGEKIAICEKYPSAIPPDEDFDIPINPRICKWLMMLKAKDADFADPDCRNVDLSKTNTTPKEEPILSIQEINKGLEQGRYKVTGYISI